MIGQKLQLPAIITFFSALYGSDTITTRQCNFETDYTALVDLLDNQEEGRGLLCSGNTSNTTQLEELKKTLKDNNRLSVSSTGIHAAACSDRWFVIERNGQLMGLSYCFVFTSNPFIAHRNPAGFIEMIALRKGSSDFYCTELLNMGSLYLQQERCISAITVIDFDRARIAYKQEHWKLCSVSCQKLLPSLFGTISTPIMDGAIVREMDFDTHHRDIVALLFSAQAIKNNFPADYCLTPELLHEKQEKLKNVLRGNIHMASGLESAKNSDKWFVLYKNAELVGVANCFIFAKCPTIPRYCNPQSGYLETINIKDGVDITYRFPLLNAVCSYLEKQGCTSIVTKVREEEASTIYANEGWHLGDVRCEKSL
jgi:hypothetical protein